jgi:hypothetical protein
MKGQTLFLNVLKKGKFFISSGTEQGSPERYSEEFHF